MGGRREVSIIYILQTCDQERFEARKIVFPWECLNIFATGCSLVVEVSDSKHPFFINCSIILKAR